jgi:hypothetical protein
VQTCDPDVFSICTFVLVKNTLNTEKPHVRTLLEVFVEGRTGLVSARALVPKVGGSAPLGALRLFRGALEP